jgi:hypothetical protein
MPRIGNIYGHGFDNAQVALIERAGFSFRPKVSMYAGAQACRFIDFEKGPCLELIEVLNQNEYLDFVPEGMKPYCPGIAIVLPGDAEPSLDTFARQFTRLHPYLLHVNYDGTSGSGRPGWNYLNFGTPVVPGIFIWLTVMDEPRPPRAPIPSHANGVTGIIGFVLDMESESLKDLSELLGEDTADGALDIGGVKVWSKSATEDLPKRDEKQFPLQAVVLESRSLERTRMRIEDAAVIPFMSKRALRIATNRLSWDLLVVEQ